MSADAERKMDVVITAGGRIGGTFAAAEGVTVKALLSLQGRTLLERVLTAFRHSPASERIVVVGPPEVEGVASRAGADRFVPEGETGLDNVLRGLQALSAGGKVILSTSDLPLLAGADVEGFLARVPETALVGYAVYRREEFARAFPQRKTQYVSLADGDFVGGCVFLVDADLIRRMEPLLQAGFARRKSPTALMHLAGWRVTSKFLLSRVLGRRFAPSSGELQQRAEALLKGKCVLVHGASPHLALDVDTYEDWQWLQERLRE
ncbi:MAG TPA: hypothetical protein EYP85_03145 [Armatimonadetes bacterium]|nr:hypothetical protein [Armatimonadota bacterium]